MTIISGPHCLALSLILYENELGRRTARRSKEGKRHAADCLCIRSRDADLRGDVRPCRAHRTASRNTSRARWSDSGLFASLPAPVHCHTAHAPLRVSPLLVAARPVPLVSLWPGTLGVLVRRRRRPSAKLLRQDAARRICGGPSTLAGFCPWPVPALFAKITT